MNNDEESFVGEAWFIGAIVALILLAVGYLVFAPVPLAFRTEVILEVKNENNS